MYHGGAESVNEAVAPEEPPEPPPFGVEMPQFHGKFGGFGDRVGARSVNDSEDLGLASRDPPALDERGTGN